MLVLAEHRRAVLVAQESAQVPAHVFAFRVDRIAGGRDAQPHPPELRELERVRLARGEESLSHAVIVRAPATWAEIEIRAASSMPADRLTLVRMAFPAT